MLLKGVQIYIRFLRSSHVLLIPRIIMPKSQEEVDVLVRRLKTATNKADELEREVADIKRKIKTLTSELNTGDDSPDNNAGPPNKKIKHEFVKDDSGFVVVYTDGACENNGASNAKAGIGVWFGHNHPLNISLPVRGRPTNNNAEIQACSAAVKTAMENGVKKLKIFTDSQFTINCMTKWLQGWKKKNWKLAAGGPVKNKEELEELDNLCQSSDIDVKFEHVPGHKGHEGNEMADELARNGAVQYRH